MAYNCFEAPEASMGNTYYRHNYLEEPECNMEMADTYLELHESSMDMTHNYLYIPPGSMGMTHMSITTLS